MNVRLKEIPLAAIDVGENVRTIRDADQDSALAQNVRENGALQPVCVAQIPGTERFQPVFGSRRLGAHREAGHTTIIAMVLDEVPRPDETTIRQLSENFARVPLHPVDLLTAVGGLVSAGWTGATIAKRLGERESTVCRWIAVAKHASVDLRQRIRAGTLSLSGAYDLCKLPPDARGAVLADAPENQLLTREALARKIRRVQRLTRSGNRATTIRRITAHVGRATSVTFVGRSLSLGEIVQLLGELLARANQAQAEGQTLTEFAWALRAERRAAPGGAK